MPYIEDHLCPPLHSISPQDPSLSLIFPHCAFFLPFVPSRVVVLVACLSRLCHASRTFLATDACVCAELCFLLRLLPQSLIIPALSSASSLHHPHLLYSPISSLSTSSFISTSLLPASDLIPDLIVLFLPSSTLFTSLSSSKLLPVYSI